MTPAEAFDVLAREASGACANFTAAPANEGYPLCETCGWSKQPHQMREGLNALRLALAAGSDGEGASGQDRTGRGTHV